MEIIFQEHPDIWLGSSLFRNVPVIIQYKNTPVLEVVESVQSGSFESGFTIKFPVYHNDGTHIATVKGKRIHLTEDGKKANITQRFEPGLTICEFEGRAILEIRRDGAAAVQGWAELYAPEGILIKSLYPKLSQKLTKDGDLTIGTQVFKGAHFEGHRIGIHCLEDGKVHLGIKHLRYTGPAEETNK